jgi:hypothetical protein
VDFPLDPVDVEPYLVADVEPYLPFGDPLAVVLVQPFADPVDPVDPVGSVVISSLTAVPVEREY